MKIDFSGRTAIVTGASSGIGAAYAKALAEQGADVAILARRVQKLEAVAKECETFGVKCLPVACDVTDEESIQAAVKQVADAFGRIDILINNAGVCEFSLLEDHTTAQWDKVIATDLTSAFLMAREVAPYFKVQHYGRVVNTASVGAPMRYVLIGMSLLVHLLVVCHCFRPEGNVIRIISARRATENEECQNWRQLS